MADWTIVKWTQAGQVLDLMAIDEDAALRPAVGADPQSFFDDLRRSGRLEMAVTFVGHALPRYEAVAWAARLLSEQAARTPLIPRDRAALDGALRWVAEPNDENRRAADSAADAAGRRSAERLLGMAVSVSGGSMVPAGFEPVLPAPGLCGRLAASAVILAAHRGRDAPRSLAAALDLGDLIAREGLNAEGAA